ncbi:uncharacterized protein LOC142240110 [Haematobia irritans]|uniref:uncharacterized protein LOC142240110 n=1 Tax=Haematobia irritans TaxID=7368 RepID=UPI003F4F4014
MVGKYCSPLKEGLCGTLCVPKAGQGTLGDVAVLIPLVFTAVIRPVATYGRHVWWTITRHRKHIQKFSRINRTALIYMTGAMRTTATAAQEVLMGICPLDLYIRKTAEVVLMRLKSLDLLGNTACRHTELVGSVGQRLRTDYMATRHVYEGKLRLIIPSIDDWEEKRIPFRDVQIYADGSKMAEGAAISCEKLGISESYGMDNACSIFQTEVFAIAKAAELMLMRLIFRSEISFFIDSQAAITTLGNPNITSKIVSRCRRELRAFTEQHNITLCWIPGHYGIMGNEEADVLAKEGARGTNNRCLPPLSLYT